MLSSMQSPGKFSRRTCASAVAAVLLLLAGLVSAEPVTLRASDGSVTVVGTLERFDGINYSISTSLLGKMNLPAQHFTCSAGPCPSPPAMFGIHGSNTIGSHLMPALIEAYSVSIGARALLTGGSSPEEVDVSIANADGRELAKIQVHSHGSGTATPGLASGKAVLGMISRPMKDDEAQKLAAAGFGDMRRSEREHVLGLDALLVLVSQSNPVTRLSIKQLAEIFSGAVTDWTAVGGAPGKIKVYSRDNKSGTYDTFKALVLDSQKLKLSKEARLFESSPDLADAVARDPNGIGFVGFAYQRNAKAIALSNECGMSFEPDIFHVKTEEYPLSRRLFLYSAPVQSGSFAEKLLHFTLSAQAQDVVKEAGFIDQTMSSLPSIRQIARIADLAAANWQPEQMKSLTQLAAHLRASTRLSVTFRFRSGSAQLDSKATRDVGRLADFVRFLEINQPSRKILLMGFADAVGAFDANTKLALGRAEAVQRAVADTLQSPRIAGLIETRSYGPLLPVACNDSDDGKAKNRRVEVWLK